MNYGELKYEYDKISDLHLGDNDLSGSMSEELRQRIIKVMGEAEIDIPISFKLAINIKNKPRQISMKNTTPDKTIKGFSYVLYIDSIQVAEDSINETFNIKSMQTISIPLNIKINLPSLLKGKQSNHIKNSIKNFIGAGDKKSDVVLKIYPKTDLEYKSQTAKSIQFKYAGRSGNMDFTDNEQQILNGYPDAPLRVLLITNHEDSIILRKKSHDLDIRAIGEDKNIEQLINRLKVTMDTAGGIGIAAPQVGINRNVFLFTRLDLPDKPVQVAINPQITKHSKNEFGFDGDGCLSIPNTRGISRRYQWVEVVFYDETGKRHAERLKAGQRGEDFTGGIFQHEFDHLQGILFTDKLFE